MFDCGMHMGYNDEVGDSLLGLGTRPSSHQAFSLSDWLVSFSPSGD